MSEQINTAIRWARERFSECSESPRLDAEVLLSHCLEKPRSYLYSWPEKTLSDRCWEQFQELVHKRQQPTPVAYLLGQREFYSLDFAISAATLVPRPETEILVEQALPLIPEDSGFRVCDLGTGTGIIAITLKKQRPAANLYATDVDPECLAVAADNARRHDVSIELIESDWYRNIPVSLQFDLIVSNPPYIASQHPFLKQGDLPAEPQIALTPGESGLEALEQIIAQAPNFLRPGGWMILEHGYDQQAAVADLLAKAGFIDVHCQADYNGLPRASLAKRVDNNHSEA